MVTTVNSIGAAFQLVYIILFITYTDKRKKVVYSFRITQSCLCGGVLDSPLCCSKMFIHLCTPRMLWAGEDVWAADGRYCLILSHSCWELGNKWLYHSADGCWVLELCCSHIYVCFSIVCNCKCLKWLFHSRWMWVSLNCLFLMDCLFFSSIMSIWQNLVIQTRSVEFMPFYLSLSTFLMSASFLAYGILNNDPFVYVSFLTSFTLHFLSFFCVAQNLHLCFPTIWMHYM